MAQFGRPSTDTTNEGYTNDAGGSASIYQAIDEVTQSDVDFIQSALGPTSDVYVTKLTSVTDPAVSTGHIVRYTVGKSGGGATIDATVDLRQGYVSEASQGTLIVSWTHANVAAGFNLQAQTLTGPQADAITNYGDLYIRIVYNQV